MSYFLNALGLELRQRYRPAGLCILLVVVLGLTALLLVPAAVPSAAVQVGLVLPEQGGEELHTLLRSRSSDLVEFIPTDLQTMERNILTGTWDCGLLVPEDLAERLAQSDTDGLLLLKLGPGSTVYPLVRETVSACLMELLSPHIAQAYLQEIGGDGQALQQRLVELQETAPRVQVNLQTPDGSEMNALTLTERGMKRMCVGICGILLLLFGLYSAVDLGKWMQTPAAQRLAAVRSPIMLLLPRLLAGFAPVLLWGLLVLPHLWGGWHTAAGFFALWVTVGAMALVGSRSPAVCRGVPVLIPFLAVGSLIMEPVLVDTALLFPALSRFTAWLPLTLFLRACGGDMGSLCWLLGEGAALTGLFLLPAGKK